MSKDFPSANPLLSFVEDVDELLKLNDRIRERLEIPHGWTAEQIAAHAREVDERKLLEHSLRASVDKLKRERHE